jgi:predicted phosphodiesterase
MKLHILSDVHLEFGYLPPPQVDADVTVLAGDIGLGLMGAEWALELARERPVVYVCGNHEYYRQPPVPLVQEALREAFAGTGVRYLENHAAIIDGVRFLGATLWTDFRMLGRRDEGMESARRLMSDYQVIAMVRSGPGTANHAQLWDCLVPDDTLGFHEQSRAWLEGELVAQFSGVTVVVTHHAPSPRSLRPGYAAEPTAAAYASNLEALMDGSRAALWVHGHVHKSSDYRANGTRVLCNPRGYTGFALNPAFDSRLVVEI